MSSRRYYSIAVPKIEPGLEEGASDVPSVALRRILCVAKEPIFHAILGLHF